MKAETVSPIFKTESIFLSYIIDTKENRDVATCKISGTFMKSDKDDMIHVPLTRRLATLLAHTYLENTKNVLYTKRTYQSYT